MGTTRAWNITDDPTTKVAEQVVVIRGKAVMPGSWVPVDESDLPKAHKLKEDILNGLVYIGKTPPARYVATKNPPRARLDASVKRSQGKAEPKLLVVLPKPAEKAVKLEDKVEPPVDMAQLNAMDPVDPQMKIEEPHRHGKRGKGEK